MINRREEFQKYGLYDPRFEHDSCGVGFVCDIKGRRTNTVVKNGIGVLKRLSHRGATGADPKTGDGAGILIQIPHEFLAKECDKAGFSLPARGECGVGMVFLPVNAKERKYCKDIFAKVVKDSGCAIIGWREVPVDDSVIGVTARNTQPAIEQVFIRPLTLPSPQRGEGEGEGDAFERILFVIRKKIENVVRNSKLKQKSSFYITNLSSRTLLYKGLLMPEQLDSFFVDLKDADIASALCLVHSRYSTNTFPTWDLSQPFRFLAHNGEINTLRGNINWMQARQGLLESKLFGSDLKNIIPVVVPGGSDSASLDNAFELLTLAGRPIQHVMMMLIPSAWHRDNSIDDKLKAFYEYHACLMEPWDGPAAIAFTDGTSIGACLDRNGLRPARYIITKSDLVVMASEVGVLDIKPEDIKVSGRLLPGKMFFVDTQEGRIVEDSELKENIANSQPYGKWVKENLVELDNIGPEPRTPNPEPRTDILIQLKAFGYIREDLKFIIKPMLETAQEPVGSMGNDTPHAVLSKNPQLLYNYFKQLFAQVTNPPVDPIREELVMSLESFVGPEKNILDETPRHCHKLKVQRPILTDEELGKIRGIKVNAFKAKTISILFDAKDEKYFLKSLDRICKEALSAIKNGYTFIILSDRDGKSDRAALPCLLAVGCVHQYLVKNSLRNQIGIIVESAEPREVHHFALLFGYGADCVNPYLIYESINYLKKEGELGLDFKTAQQNYIKAINKGILKILSKMGISTLQSYRGAQIFEAVGLDKDIVDRCFSGTVSRIAGAGFDVIAKEAILRHKHAYPERGLSVNYLSSGGLYQYRRDGEFHLWNPDSIASLQDAVRKNSVKKYEEFSRFINDQSANPCTLRSLIKFKNVKQPVDIRQVEPVSEIVRRFATGAMSFGSISKSAHETIAIAMNRLKAKSNTGEGGEDPARFISLANGDSKRSAIKQVASGRFGVTANYLVSADELQIKIAQGAKPGEGGQLPGHKVSAIIAKTRYTTPGVTLISPPPHHDIYSIEDLAQLIFDLKNVNPRARISVKLVSEIGVGTIAAGVAKGHADMILISGGDGGTGASPLSSIKHAGLPWELGLSETHQTLVLNDLRSRVRLQTDGQMRTGRDVAIAALLGAEEFGFSTAVLITLGCVMLRHCHLNNCSLGVATQDEVLEKRFQGKPEYIINYFQFVAEELRQIMSSLGVKSLDEMIGRTDLLEVNKKILPWKAQNLDFSRIFYQASSPRRGSLSPKPKAKGKGQGEGVKRNETPSSPSSPHRGEDELKKILDFKLLELTKPALEKSEQIKIELPIENTNRSVGAMLSGELCKRWGEDGLPSDTINCKFSGVAGQSFGAFLAKGITFELEGMANDYVGKGISGGKIIIYPDKNANFVPEKNIIIGNTTFYGAITGEAYIRGVAGERFCIRNSGLYAVVEGTGDHGCEYMTGGRVMVLGETGRNFGAGMSGGIAYVYDDKNDFKNRCNLDMVVLEKLSEEDIQTVNNLLINHHRYTQSKLAKAMLDDFKAHVKKFVKVMPLEYKRILGESKAENKSDLTEVSDG